MKTYLVGGAVRDKLLNLTPKERDFVVVGGTPEEMTKLGFKPVGKDFPVFLHPDTGEEYALARTEKKAGRGYGGFTFYTSPQITLEQDLARRDLTINALAEVDGKIVDPFGGQTDIKSKQLRHVSDAFIEDPLRVLRVARFAARFKHLGFSVAAETLELMKTISQSGELNDLTAERVWLEMEKALGEQSPEAFIEVLRECGALKVLLPEVDRLFGVPQRAEYHPEVDTGIHLIMSLKIAAKLTNDPMIRFAVLTHDLGKGITPSEDLPRHIGHEQAGAPLVEALCTRFKTPNKYRELALAVCRFHLLCHQATSLRPATVLKLLNRLDAYRRPERFEQFILACQADAQGRLGFEEKPYPSGQWLKNAYLATADVRAAKFIEQGITGKNLGEAIDKARITILKELRTKNSNR